MSAARRGGHIRLAQAHAVAMQGRQPGKTHRFDAKTHRYDGKTHRRSDEEVTAAAHGEAFAARPMLE
eukprot:CAMPEP_0181169032 /NCGR_PEP_ID=MMETSP1096-20121128/596_1 /TAXON_ID=156174 ORGANISM="Chrysochromulina ericina, Strain CCMP281" /NCGR_SAMPLE_ID=MMETSP1096 /ASSEMBLY_ACC=CAM_ASM_000453 /LENGTH=66 /DNA_ID=CAMNT_0023256459 /DNA_START=357 /DNA_END=557 /DNA_ORIENTATION=-